MEDTEVKMQELLLLFRKNLEHFGKSATSEDATTTGKVPSEILEKLGELNEQLPG